MQSILPLKKEEENMAEWWNTIMEYWGNYIFGY